MLIRLQLVGNVNHHGNVIEALKRGQYAMHASLMIKVVIKINIKNVMIVYPHFINVISLLILSIQLVMNVQKIQLKDVLSNRWLVETIADIFHNIFVIVQIEKILRVENALLVSKDVILIKLQHVEIVYHRHIFVTKLMKKIQYAENVDKEKVDVIQVNRKHVKIVYQSLNTNVINKTL